MEVFWEEEERPDVNEWGISKQLIYLTNKGSYSTGYYRKETDTYLTEGFLFNDEMVVAWLRGITPCKVVAEKKEQEKPKITQLSFLEEEKV